MLMPTLKKNSKQPPWLGKRKAFATERSKQEQTEERSKWQKFYNSAKWRKVSKFYAVSVAWLCESCLKEEKYIDTSPVDGKPRGATDHIVALKAGGKPYEFKNLQRLCLSCHAKKSGSEAHRKG